MALLANPKVDDAIEPVQLPIRFTGEVEMNFAMFNAGRVSPARALSRGGMSDTSQFRQPDPSMFRPLTLKEHMRRFVKERGVFSIGDAANAYGGNLMASEVERFFSEIGCHVARTGPKGGRSTRAAVWACEGDGERCRRVHVHELYVTRSRAAEKLRVAAERATAKESLAKLLSSVDATVAAELAARAR